jgi:hypothetical protein
MEVSQQIPSLGRGYIDLRDNYHIARLEGCYRAADLDDSAGGLVAQDHGFSDNKLADLAVFPVVHIGPADSSIVDCDQDIVRR